MLRTPGFTARQTVRGVGKSDTSLTDVHHRLSRCVGERTWNAVRGSVLWIVWLDSSTAFRHGGGRVGIVVRVSQVRLGGAVGTRALLLY